VLTLYSLVKMLGSLSRCPDSKAVLTRYRKISKKVPPELKWVFESGQRDREAMQENRYGKAGIEKAKQRNCV